MMGIKERVFSPLPRDISLEELVPRDSFYRRLEGALDLSFVRELVRPLYARGGRHSVDPTVFFRLQLVMLFEGIRSERELMRVAADRLSVRWYLGYDLHEPLPDHSHLTRARERFGLSVFRRFFEEIVERCIEAGLVLGEELFFDSTKVAANADVDSLAPRWAVEAHLDGLFEQQNQSEEVSSTAGEHAPPDTLPTAEDTNLQEVSASASNWISRDVAQDRSFKNWRERTSDTRASTTDPDATPAARAGPGTKLGYQTHYVVDGGKARIVLNVLVTPSEVSENRPMLDLLWRTCFQWKLRPHHVTGDGKYGTVENIKALEASGSRAYTALHESGGNAKKFFPKSAFTYDPDNDRYLCPAGEILPRISRSGKTRIKYRAAGSVCNACALKPQCTTNLQGRSVNRGPGEEYIDRVRRYMQTEPYKKALRKRKVWVEPLFAEAKAWHGMSRFRLRTLWRVNIEALLVATGQNLKRLVDFSGHRPRKPAQIVALRPPTIARREFQRAHRRRVGR